MTNQYLFNDLFINHINQIVFRLKKESYNLKSGRYWDFHGMDKNGMINKSYDESIYKGQAGVLLFLNRLIEQSLGDEDIENLLEQAAQYSLNFALNGSRHYGLSFYTGRLGLIYVLLIYTSRVENLQILNDLQILFEKYLNDLVQNKENIPLDLLLGKSGIIIGLLLIKSDGRLNFNDKIIHDLINDLISGIKLGPKGIYWESRLDQFNPLCGYSHGVAGICHTLLEVYNITELEILKEIAIEGFKYEDFHFNIKYNNWPDFRAFDKDNSDWQTLVKSFNEKVSNPIFFAWCHGAPGIILARLRAFDILKDNSFSRISKLGIKSTKSWLKTNFKESNSSLCHGFSGNAFSVLQSSYENNDFESINELKSLTKEVLDNNDKLGFVKSGYSGLNNEDFSLFMGSSGLGYFLLNLLEKDENQLLCPKVPKEVKLTKYKPRFNGLKVLEDSLKKDYILKQSNYVNIEKENLVDFVSRSYSIKTKLKNSHALNKFYKERKEEKYVITDKISLVLSELVEIEALNTDLENIYLLRLIVPLNVINFKLSLFTYKVLSSFSEPRNLKEVFDMVKNEFYGAEIKEFESGFNSQISSAFKSGILLPSNIESPKTNFFTY